MTDAAAAKGHGAFVALERGCLMLAFSRTKKPEEVLIQVKLDTRELVWNYRGGGGIKFGLKSRADLRIIQEIRPGKKSREFERSHEDVVRHDSSLCMVIMYGNSFKLKSLALAVVTNTADRDLWIRGLKELIADTRKATYPVYVDRWLRKEFYNIERLGKITFRDFKTWLLLVDLKISSRKVQELYKEVRSDMKEVNYDEFVKLYRNLMFIPEIFKNYFEKYLDSNKLISLESFKNFLVHEQKETFASDTDAVRALIVQCKENKQEFHFTAHEFLDYLFSEQNNIWDSQHSQVNQDMDKPLSSYWIASSHNTYLTGDQIKSESSTEAYARVLQRGCRCIELDCWDGPDDYPHIYHGHTLTSRIRFLDVLKTIRENAFVASDYPVILSIENHCSLPQQNAMARGFKDVFGDLLVTTPVATNEVALPSPNLLKHKIIIKHKKLRDHGSHRFPERGKRVEKSESLKEKQSDDGNLDLSAALKTGILHLQDPFDKKWKPYFFVLTSSTLLYTEETEAAEDDNTPVPNGIPKIEEEAEEVNEENRHKSEVWYHGSIKREEAEKILMDNLHFGDGTFLVRESGTFQEKGECSLSFVHNSSPRNHCRIHCTQNGSRTKYFLTDIHFDTISDLVQYHQKYPLKSKGLKQLLRHPASTKPAHVNEPWFYAKLSRVEAEEKLSRIPTNGVFLLRQRTTGIHEHKSIQYVISFRADRKIKHCLIKRSGHSFIIADRVFGNLVQLVDHYSKYPFYRKTKLKYPLTEKLLKEWGTASDGQTSTDIAISLDQASARPNSFISKIKVRALIDYRGQKDDELSFCKDAVITDVEKEDGEWWRGSYGGKERCWFPVNAVEEIDLSANRKSLPTVGNLNQGSIDMTFQGITISRLRKPECEPMKVFRMSFPNAPSREIAASSEGELEEWLRALSERISNVSKIAEERKFAEATMNIAKELSDLIVYCISSPVDIEKVMASAEITSHADMFSKAETQLVRFLNKERCQSLVALTSQRLIRVYPKGQRFDSSNYDPVQMWSCGCQFVALNYQTPDVSMQMNEGLFSMNGRCGYVLKPDCMNQSSFNPFCHREKVKGVEPVTISISIIGARHVLKPGRGSTSAVEVEIEVFGCAHEGKNKWKTSVRVDNGLNPVWKDQHMLVDIHNPDMSMIRFCVQDLDMFGDNNCLGQAVFPVKCLKTGYRSIQLRNEYCEPLELASLLVHFSFIEVGKCDLIYTSIQELRFEGNRILEQLENHKKAKNSAVVRQLEQRLAKIQSIIFEKMEMRKSVFV